MILAEASEAAVLLEKDGRFYRVCPEPEDLWTGYDPTAVQQALLEYADLLTPAEGKRAIAALYNAREQGTRPESRPSSWCICSIRTGLSKECQAIAGILGADLQVPTP